MPIIHSSELKMNVVNQDIDLKLLYAIYSFEAVRISGTHGGMRRFRIVLETLMNSKIT